MRGQPGAGGSRVPGAAGCRGGQGVRGAGGQACRVAGRYSTVTGRWSDAALARSEAVIS
jgi:hypothetical protein